MKLGRFPLVALVLAGLVTVGTADARTTIYRHATLVDATSASPRTGMTLVVRDSTILAVSTESVAGHAFDPGAVTVDLHGEFVMPGLVDTHVHLATEGDDTLAIALLRLDLMSGITTVRDMAGDTRLLSRLQSGLRAGTIAGPDLYYSALMAGPAFFVDPRTRSSAKGAVAGEVPWMRAITPASDLPTAVAQAKATGATGIKLYADLDSATAQRIVDEAGRQGLRAWAHAALFPARPSQVIATRLTSVSHAYMFGYETAEGMDTSSYARAPQVDFTTFDPAAPAFAGLVAELAEDHVALDATVHVSRAMAKAVPDTSRKHAQRLAQYRFSLKIARMAESAGVLVTTGSDAQDGEERATPGLWSELLALQNDAHFTPAELVAAATLNGAKLLGLDDRQGTLAAGKRADFIVLAGNPLADIAAIRSLVFTVKDGKPYWRSDYHLSDAEWKKLQE